jgi:uracil-DNA glycosylase family protein
MNKALKLAALRRRASGCTACPLYANATQTVFGQGTPSALMLIGEQPGDREDIEGAPFAGPAGRLLDRALSEAGIEPERCYVTNAVKHFKWEPRGKRRLHKTPAQREVDACRQWLIAEVALLQPELMVCLGATAAHAVLGRDFRLTRDHGAVGASVLGLPAMATMHPSAIYKNPGSRRPRIDVRRHGGGFTRSGRRDPLPLHMRGGRFAVGAISRQQPGAILATNGACRRTLCTPVRTLEQS